MPRASADERWSGTLRITSPRRPVCFALLVPAPAVASSGTGDYGSDVEIAGSGVLGCRAGARILAAALVGRSGQDWRGTQGDCLTDETESECE